MSNRYLKFFSSIFFSIFSLSANAGLISGSVSFKTEAGHAVKNASNVVVFLENIKSKTPFSPPVAHASMASKNKEFYPSVLPILVGTTVDFPNDDLILHNVFSLSKTKAFDLGLYKRGASKTVTFNQPGLVKVYCNIHEKMSAYVLVLENPYFAVTKNDGSFEIKDVPEGTYTISAWNRFGDRIEKQITMGDSAKANIKFDLVKGQEVNFEMIEKEVSLKHKNKWNKDYKDKY